MTDDWIPTDDWRTIVKHSPIVSVDLLVRIDGGIVLGKRQNEPAKGYWFVPGGRVQKGESREEAVHRVAKEELDADIQLVESLGAYEHFYDTADVEDAGGKHYLANGYVVEPESGGFEADEQHSELRIFNECPEPLHQYVRQYLVSSSSLSDWP